MITENNFYNKYLCLGCNACYNICSFNAIKMNEDSEGFLYPKVNKNKCNNCNACDKVCPLSNNLFKPKRTRINNGIALRSYRYASESTSGGFFAEIAFNFLAKNGYVAGAIFNNEWKVEHIISNNTTDINRMRGSKYLQSNINTTFIEAKQLLDNNKLLLFSGTPCQIAGLYGFLGKDYDNLLTIDLICYGVNSPMVWNKYFNEIPNNENITSLFFRYKSKNLYENTNIENNEYFIIKYSNNKVFKEIYQTNNYIRGFFKNLFLRPCCSNCKYCTRIRPADITIGDLWTDKAKNDRIDGISQVIFNSNKAILYFNSIDNTWTKKYKINLNKIKKYAPNINGISSEHNPLRYKFFDLIKFLPFSKALDHTLNNKFDIAIIGMHAPNYGNLLTSYSLYKILTEMGKNVLMVDRPLSSNDKPLKNIFNIFDKNPYPDYAISKIYHNKESMKELNDRINTFLLPSDQILGTHFILSYDKYTLLDWVRDDKNKISYSSSFGTDHFDGDDNLRAEIGFYLNRFDAISVREESGIKYAKDNFNINVTQVLDPVFLCNPNIFDELIKDNKVVNNNNNFLGVYFLKLSYQRSKIISNSKKLLKLDNHCIIIDYLKSLNHPNSILDLDFVEGSSNNYFLSCIKNCDFFITDSFHGMCFSIIFKKQFIVISDPNLNKAPTRITELLYKLGIFYRFVETSNEFIPNEYFLNNINYNSVYEILNSEILRSKLWLLNTLNYFSSLNKNKSEYDIINEKLSNYKIKHKISNNKLSISSNNNLFFIIITKFKKLFKNFYKYGFKYTIRLAAKKIKYYI